MALVQVMQHHLRMLLMSHMLARMKSPALALMLAASALVAALSLPAGVGYGNTHYLVTGLSAAAMLAGLLCALSITSGYFAGGSALMERDMQVGDVGKLIGGVLAVGISAIVLLTFAPTVAGNVDGLFMETKAACVYQGERFDQVTTIGTGEEADEAWGNESNNIASLTSSAGSQCQFTNASITGTNAIDVYTPKGTKIKTGTLASGVFTIGSSTTAVTKAPANSFTALAGGSLLALLFGAAAILIPAGAIAFLAYTGSEMVKENIGGGTMAVAVGAVISVVLVGSLLPEIVTPLDNLYNALDGRRFKVFASGLGQIGGVLGNFLAISLIGGIVALGALLWKGRRGGSSQGMSY